MKRRINQTRKSSKINVPEARAAMDKFKMEAAAKVDAKATEGYDDRLTSRETDSVSRIVKKMCPVRTANYRKTVRAATAHQIQTEYIFVL